MHSALRAGGARSSCSRCFFVGLDAQLVGVLQVIVYAGAIVVLFLFVIMLLNLQAEVRADAPAPPLVVAAAAGGPRASRR